MLGCGEMMSTEDPNDVEVQQSSYDASRYNAVKHGLTAKSVLLPGEDGEAYHARVGVYQRGLRTRSDFEDELATLAAQASWKLERSNRAEVARVSREITAKTEDDDERERLEAIEHEELLFFDRRGPSQLYPSRDYEPKQARTSSADDPDDPNHPAKIVCLMERTRAGCRRLLACWAGLRGILEMGVGWTSVERFRCVRLLGKQPLDAIGTPEIAEIFLACHVIEQQFPYAFQELRCEIHEERFKMHKRELERWTRAGLVPADATAAKAVLLRIIDQETSRLRMIEAKRDRIARELAELESDIRGFDESKTGEQLRRHQDRCNRLVLRNAEAVERRHRNEEQGWGRTRKERERRKSGRTEEDDGAIETRPFDDRLVLDEQGDVRSVGEYVEAGLARYHMAQWGTGEPRQKRSAASGDNPAAVPDFSRWAVAEEKRKKEEAERIAQAGCRIGEDGHGTQLDSEAADGGDDRVADVPVMLAGKGEETNVQNGFGGGVSPEPGTTSRVEFEKVEFEKIAEPQWESSDARAPERGIEDGLPTDGASMGNDRGIIDLQTSYDRVADEYVQRIFGELEHKAIDRQLLDQFAARANKIGPICDLGCGPGHIARYLHDRGAQVIGVDLSHAMVERARRLNPGIEFRQGDMRSLEIEDESFGGVAAFYSIIHTPRADVVGVLGEMKRILRLGGTLFMAFHVGDEIVHRDEWWGQEVFVDFVFFRPEEMTAYLKTAGFEIGEIVEREPYPDVEHPSRRAYVFAEKRQETS
jgi:SAM-dependent methyltransferase